VGRPTRYGARMPIRTPVFVALAAILLLLIAIVAGCGSDDETTTTAGATGATTATGGSESTAVTTPDDTAADGTEQELDPHIAAEKTIVAFLTDPDSESVCASISPPLLPEIYGSLAGCRNGRPPESLAKSVDIGEIKVDGEKVTATATPTGGAYDDTEIDFELAVHDGLVQITAVKADVPVGP